MASLLLTRWISTSLSPSIRGLLPAICARHFIPHTYKSFSQHSYHQSDKMVKNTSVLASNPFFNAIRNRRTYYQLKKESPISDQQIQDIVHEAVLHVPSSFNSQSTRVILLLKGEHDKLWDITKEVLRGVVPADKFAPTEQKIDGFKAGYGTVSRCPWNSCDR